MSKGPAILKISGVVMIFQALLGFFIIAMSVLSLLTKLRRKPDMASQLFNSSGIMSFVLLGLVLITTVALLVCALKSFNTYNYYTISGGNNNYLIPSKVVMIAGALTFIIGFVSLIIMEGSQGASVLVMLSSAGWLLALLNLILVKKDRAERAKEPPKKVWMV